MEPKNDHHFGTARNLDMLFGMNENAFRVGTKKCILGPVSALGRN